MKIIGIANDNVIIEADKNEIANLVGAYSKHQLDKEKDGYDYDTLFRVGVKFNISKIYNKMRNLQYIKINSEYDSARSKLKEMLDSLTPIEDLVTLLKNELEK